MLKESLERIGRLGRGAGSVGDLTAPQREHLERLRSDGYTTFTHLVGTQRLGDLQAEYRKRLEEDLDFEMPTLAQAKIDPERDADLIKSNFLASPADLARRNLTFDKADVKSYGQAVDDFAPSTLTSPVPDAIDWMSVWLDEDVLAVATAYMGFVPQMVEAFIRRNYPARFVVMNHAWHRDTNHDKHLLKGFFFLSDCTMKTGPHHYIAGSVNDRRVDGKKYYKDEEIYSVYPPESKKEIISVVPAGTFILEDTRGLHKAGVPDEGYRDLGFSTFLPPIALVKRAPMYTISRRTYEQLSANQQQCVPKENVS